MDYKLIIRDGGYPFELFINESQVEKMKDKKRDGGSSMINNKRIEKCFANHVAIMKYFDKDMQVLKWKQLGTMFHEIDYVFYRNMIFITGDFRDAVFNFTWSPRWNTDWETICLDYFAENMTAHKNGKYIWNSNYAIKNLKEHYNEYFTELSESQFAEMTDYLIEKIKYYPFTFDADDDEIENIPYINVVENRNILLQYHTVLYHALYAGSDSEFVYNLQNDSHFNDFNDFLECGYKCGYKLNSDIEYYLIGLQMARKQIMERNYK